MWIMLSQISPAARMSACVACGGNVKEIPALTTGVFIEHEGEIEVCRRCIVEAALMFGLVESARLVELQAEIDELREWAEVAYTELETRQGTITTITSALANVVHERDALLQAAEAAE